MEGNYKSSFAVRIPACDTIIFLDYPKYLALWRAIKRFFQKFGTKRPEVGGNNSEKIDMPFLKWIVTYPRNLVLSEIRKYRKKQNCFTITSPKELDIFLEKL